MAEADIARLKTNGRQIWQRHFDDRLGLSAAEMLRLSTVPLRPLPANEPLLADRPEHIVPWGTRKPPVEAGNPANRWGFDMVLPPYEAHLGELHNLSIQRGTLTAEDRFKINDHIVQTIIADCGRPALQTTQDAVRVAQDHDPHGARAAHRCRGVPLLPDQWCVAGLRRALPDSRAAR